MNECVGTKIPEDGEEEDPARIEVEAETFRQIQDMLQYYNMYISTQRSTLIFKVSGLVCFSLYHQIHSSLKTAAAESSMGPILETHTHFYVLTHWGLYLQPLNLIKPMHFNHKATFILYVNLLTKAVGAFILCWTTHLKWNN